MDEHTSDHLGDGCYLQNSDLFKLWSSGYHSGGVTGFPPYLTQYAHLLSFLSGGHGFKTQFQISVLFVQAKAGGTRRRVGADGQRVQQSAAGDDVVGSTRLEAAEEAAKETPEERESQRRGLGAGRKSE